MLAATTKRGHATPVASRPSTCSSCATGARSARPTWSSAPDPTMRSWRCSSAAARSGWRWSRSAAAPRWSAGYDRTRRGFAGVRRARPRRLDALVELDEESRLAVLEPGPARPGGRGAARRAGVHDRPLPAVVRVRDARRLRRRPLERPGSAGYGRFDERVLALRVATPAGTLELGRAPKSAAGPDLRQLMLGSEGTFGVITSLTLAVRPGARAPRLRGLAMLPSFADGDRARARAGPGRAAADRAAALGRGRDRAWAWPVLRR